MMIDPLGRLLAGAFKTRRLALLALLWSPIVAYLWIIAFIPSIAPLQGTAFGYHLVALGALFQFLCSEGGGGGGVC
jgi:hypothetical protein